MSNEELSHTVADTEDQNTTDVVYVKDRPFRKLFKHVLVVSVTAVVLLFVFGFISGLMGHRIPYIDDEAISNQWSNLTGGDSDNTEWNELERN